MSQEAKTELEAGAELSPGLCRTRAMIWGKTWLPRSPSFFVSFSRGTKDSMCLKAWSELQTASKQKEIIIIQRIIPVFFPRH